MAAVGGLVFMLGAIGIIWYYFSPQYTDVGYRPKQPVAYSHKLHAGDLGIDCRYCHTQVETQARATLPPTQTCMNCHTLIKAESEKLALVRQSSAEGKPLEWIRVHDLPDFSFFNHSVHLNAGVGCASCHGNVAQMETVAQVKPLSMGWCLDCHRQPDDHLRPLAEVTNMKWKPGSNQAEFAAMAKTERKLKPPIDCSACHR